MTPTKQTILAALEKFARQRPGLKFGNYGDATSYLAEMRRITKDLAHARELLASVALKNSIDAECLLRAAKTGRLSLIPHENGTVTIYYRTGQYWPTEYRRAVCSVLAGALWEYWRESGMSPIETARKNLSRGVATRFFN